MKQHSLEQCCFLIRPALYNEHTIDDLAELCGTENNWLKGLSYETTHFVTVEEAYSIGAVNVLSNIGLFSNNPDQSKTSVPCT
jgi:hypothetical protein